MAALKSLGRIRSGSVAVLDEAIALARFQGDFLGCLAYPRVFGGFAAALGDARNWAPYRAPRRCWMAFAGPNVDTAGVDPILGRLVVTVAAYRANFGEW